MGGRPSPDVFGKQFHIASPIQDQFGVITPSSLHGLPALPEQGDPGGRSTRQTESAEGQDADWR
jgi:hypothetical protein